MAQSDYSEYFNIYKPILKKILNTTDDTTTSSSAKVESVKKGNKILIKKKNRGKFSEYCGGKVTQKCIDKAKKSPSPTLRKRATFAENSRHWKHK